MKDYAFSRNSRLCLKRDFEAVFDVGKKTVTKELITWHCLSQEQSKIGLMVSKKCGCAVKRNRLKRLLREAFRLSKKEFKEGIRLIIYPKTGCKISNLQQARLALNQFRRMARLLE